jgi:hypothetical protein
MTILGKDGLGKFRNVLMMQLDQNLKLSKIDA